VVDVVSHYECVKVTIFFDPGATAHLIFTRLSPPRVCSERICEVGRQAPSSFTLTLAEGGAGLVKMGPPNQSVGPGGYKLCFGAIIQAFHLKTNFQN
jgi:hypothetical protein